VPLLGVAAEVTDCFAVDKTAMVVIGVLITKVVRREAPSGTPHPPASDAMLCRSHGGADRG
jgi:hypothetical protein